MSWLKRLTGDTERRRIKAERSKQEAVQQMADSVMPDLEDRVRRAVEEAVEAKRKEGDKID